MTARLKRWGCMDGYAFAVFCQVHEVLYQRMFWLLLGLLLAAPPPGEPAAPAAEPPQP